MKAETIICISSFFSAWGDRMWSFAVGLYMIKITPGSLQLAAIYGLCLTAMGVMFAPVVGDWVDRNARLFVVRLTLILQNILVIVCALFILLYLHHVTKDQNILRVLQAVIIIIGSLANLAGQGEKIAVTRDWIVVVCNGDKALLATTNALLRRIDLSVAILAPVGVGFLMTVISDEAGIVFICVWNVMSMFAEYFLLLKVYKKVPQLANKANKSENINQDEMDENQTEIDVQVIKKKSNWNFFERFKTVISGWQIYKKQSVAMAGMSLAMLYLTVLGFNAITTGYAYSQNLSELIVSVCFGLGSLVGIAGTFLFPLIRLRIGLPRTGVFGFLLQLSMLLFCVASIWTPGSPSEIFSRSNDLHVTNAPILATTKASIMRNSTSASTSSLNLTSLSTPTKIPNSFQQSYTSITLLMVGIILSRAGLWISDLTITQLQQENVVEAERGIVGGVQYSFNSTFDLLHFIVTIFLPQPEQFGYLTLMSVGAVTFGSVIYIIFCTRFREDRCLKSIDVDDDEVFEPEA